MKKNKLNSVIVTLDDCILDGYSEEGVLLLYAVFDGEITSDSVPVKYHVIFSWHGGRYSATLRRFNSAVTAMRSYRRFITMSEEIKRGMV
jgi:hypothetical protein